MREWIEDILLSIHVWSGTRLYSEVILYCPDEENVSVVHFYDEEKVLVQSCREIIEDYDGPD